LVYITYMSGTITSDVTMKFLIRSIFAMITLTHVVVTLTPIALAACYLLLKTKAELHKVEEEGDAICGVKSSELYDASNNDEWCRYKWESKRTRPYTIFFNLATKFFKTATSTLFWPILFVALIVLICSGRPNRYESRQQNRYGRALTAD